MAKLSGQKELAVTINRANLNDRKITKFYRRSKDGGLIPLHFQYVTIGDNDTFMQITGEVFTAKGEQETGRIVGEIILDRNHDIPMPKSNAPFTPGVFGYR
jgi:hypothetical protein